MPAFSQERRDNVDRVFDKLRKKNPKQMEIIYKKLEQILENPYKFKPLRSDMHGTREVHIDKHFVLVYSIDKERSVVIIEDYDHHDAIFGR